MKFESVATPETGPNREWANRESDMLRRVEHMAPNPPLAGALRRACEDMTRVLERRDAA